MVVIIVVGVLCRYLDYYGELFGEIMVVMMLVNMCFGLDVEFGVNNIIFMGVVIGIDIVDLKECLVFV